MFGIKNEWKYSIFENNNPNIVSTKLQSCKKFLAENREH